MPGKDNSKKKSLMDYVEDAKKSGYLGTKAKVTAMAISRRKKKKNNPHKY